jgi:hypothetical protein
VKRRAASSSDRFLLIGSDGRDGPDGADGPEGALSFVSFIPFNTAENPVSTDGFCLPDAGVVEGGVPGDGAMPIDAWGWINPLLRR